MAITPGSIVKYTDSDEKTWAATVINTFTDEENNSMTTISIYGKGDTVVVKESDLSE